jgi:predicted DNA-binding protein YlxM (UPF0122 family)
MERNIELGMLLTWYGAFLTERQQTLLALHVDEDLSLSEIAESEGISRQGVHDALKRAESQLLEMEARLGLVRRTTAVQEGLAALSESILKAHVPEGEKQALLRQVESMQNHWEDEHGV